MNSTDSQINNIAALEKIKQVAIENKLTELERIIKDIEEKYYPWLLEGYSFEKR